MKYLKHLITIILIAIASSSFGAGYFKIGDIKGESTDDKHKDWIEILSVSQGDSKSGTSSIANRRRGETTLGDVVVVKEIDKSSPKLAEAVKNQTIFPSIELTKANQTFTYTDVRVVKIDRHGNKEHITLSYQGLKTETPSRAAGKNLKSKSASEAPATDYNSSRSNRG